MAGLVDGQLEAFYAEVGRRIASLRRSRNRTQDDLASSIGLTRTSLTNIERGKQRVLIHTISMIADELKVDVADLVPKAQSSGQVLDHIPETTKQLLMRVVPEIKGSDN